jgi:NTP pyrophosphatase (non-canonical NTP hydrolase)
MYYIYHIFGKKIGVTRNLNKRVEVAQGYMPGEYEVIEVHDDIRHVSNRERELQRLYGYKVDRDSYKQVIDSKNKLNKSNKMKLNITEQTITFPCPTNKLKGQLLDSLGLTFETQYGKYILNTELADWIAQNASVSMFNINRSFVYNKALSNAFPDPFTKMQPETTRVQESTVADMRRQLTEMLNEVLNNKQPQEEIDPNANVYDLIRSWALNKGIYTSGDSKTQYVKLMEESGELARAILKRDKREIKDAIGDMVVVLTNLAYLEGFDIEDCVTSAYEVIKSRTGKMENGTFVKSTL